jgi:Flp pilus assembly pilin Flp
MRRTARRPMNMGPKRSPNGGKFAMKIAFASLRKLILDESGGEVLEYAIVSGLIVVASISLVTQVGTKVLARWNSLNSKL